MTASDSLHSDWTTTGFSSGLPSAVTDLGLIYESLASGLRMNYEWRTPNDESRMNAFFSAWLPL
jgi:hypothetical protein